MLNYLLFIDTETSGLPKKWNRPYATPNNWPYAIQVAWTIYTKEATLVKEENFFIKDESIRIEPGAQKIHGITKDFLQQHGVTKTEVLHKLSKDLEHYQPMIVGHCLELDFHILGAEYNRSALENLLADKKHFCTMLSTTHLVRNPAAKYLRLGELYALLFSETFPQHNALNDARATAQCFFEMLQRGDITEEKIASQPLLREPALSKKTKSYSPLILLILIIIFVLYLWIHDWLF